MIVRYSDGGTFGKTCGNWKIMGSFLTEQEAVAMADYIEDGTMEKNSEHPYSLPWVGYFNRLEGVAIHCFTINDTPTRRVIHH